MTKTQEEHLCRDIHKIAQALEKIARALPSAEQEAPDINVGNMDTISRQQAIEALKICDANYDGTHCDKCPLRDDRWNGAWRDDETDCHTKLMRDTAKLLETLSAQSERKDAIEKAVAVEAISDELMSRFDVSATYAYEVAEKAMNRIEEMAKEMGKR